MICNQCPRKCNIDRTKAVGYCKSPNGFKLARASLHFWEEPCISGEMALVQYFLVAVILVVCSAKTTILAIILKAWKSATIG